MKPWLCALLLPAALARSGPANPGEGAPDAAIVVTPNADGLADLTAIGPAEAPGQVPNPFRARVHPRSQTREVTLAIGSVLVGVPPAEPSILINGAIYARGDTWEDLLITGITAEWLELRHGPVLVRIPVRDEPAVLRMPR